MKTSESITKIAAALVKAQAAVGKAVRDSKNPHFHSSFADLESVLDTIHEVAAANGLALLTLPGETIDGRVFFTDRLIHESGEWMEEQSSVPIGGKMDAQGYGSVTTYKRRYSAAAWFRLRQTDDDGNAATAQARPMSADTARRGTYASANEREGVRGHEPEEAPRKSKGFPAKFPGKCGECGGSIAQGETVEFIPGQPKKVRHLDCGTDSQPNDEIPFPDHP